MKPATPHSAESDAALWAARLDGSTLSVDQNNELARWLAADPTHRTLLAGYCQLSADLEQHLPLIEGIKEESAALRLAPETARPSPWLRWPRLAGVALTAAAAVALALWVTPPVSSESRQAATPAGQRQVLTLVDGTRIELNARTALEVHFERNSRHVRLADGEAFFAVAKDPARPFIVETPAGAVRVTGTQFNVRSESPADLEVTVAEGSVLVRPAGATAAEPTELKAGDQHTLRDGGARLHHLSETELANTLAWREGRIVFAGVPLREALNRFAHYHGRGIITDRDVAELRIGGRFSLDDLDGFLAAIEVTHELHISRDLSGTFHVGRRPAR